MSCPLHLPRKKIVCTITWPWNEAKVSICFSTSYAARANLLLAGAKSHDGLTGLGRVGDFACHAIEHEIGAMFDVAHGAGLTAIWSSWAKYVIDVDPERFAQFAVNVWGVQNNFHDPKETGLRGIEAWDEWCHSINLPTSLSELGIEPTDEQIHAAGGLPRISAARCCSTP